MKKEQHLILYDGTCGMCHGVVQFLLKHDSKEIFIFAPLQGETAKLFLTGSDFLPPKADTIVLVEKYQDPQQHHLYAFGKGILRIYWLLGGCWSLIGWLAFIPSFLYDWVYRLVAKNRFRWSQKRTCLIPTTNQKKKFLP